MKNKTKNRLEKKWQNLPLHHIDACVVIEALILFGDDHVSCERYLNKIGYKYRVAISISALGEIFMYLIKKIEKGIDREMTFIFLSKVFAFVRKLMDEGKITFSSPQFETYSIVEKIKTVESRAEPMDALNLATAIAENANIFVTLDKDLAGNKRIELDFEIKIKHPDEL
ncbi:MAG: hypothetical protein CVT88_06865 [Candidatus Altiarchaeales archaeon HGW-Altiarchaeales-1]|nr:MAG: hypothetical protein CVT88_06865 [Candidatus Altiarchaeales archaeon HGW-Altiarchaeales-1]